MHTYFFEGDLKGTIVLSREESNHAVKVMRTKENDLVRIINGKGTVAIGEIVSDHPKMCKVAIANTSSYDELSPKITIAIAPTKGNDRIEFFIEKATEIGVFKIIPLICRNNERDKVNLERWKKVTLAATKQSQRPWLPIIGDPVRINQLFEDNDLPETKLIAYCEELPEESITKYTGKSDLIVLIGPEGDFTKDEVTQSEQRGFIRVNLGENRLRTETAGLVALSKLIQ